MLVGVSASGQQVHHRSRPVSVGPLPVPDRVERVDVLDGLIHEYRRAA
jgi:hypothetical protein